MTSFKLLWQEGGKVKLTEIADTITSKLLFFWVFFFGNSRRKDSAGAERRKHITQQALRGTHHHRRRYKTKECSHWRPQLEVTITEEGKLGFFLK